MTIIRRCPHCGSELKPRIIDDPVTRKDGLELTAGQWEEYKDRWAEMRFPLLGKQRGLLVCSSRKCAFAVRVNGNGQGVI